MARKVKAMHIKSMPGGHTLRVEHEPDGDEAGQAPMAAPMNQDEETMHPEGSPGADHIAGLLAAHNAIHGKAPKKSAPKMNAGAMRAAAGRGYPGSTE